MKGNRISREKAKVLAMAGSMTHGLQSLEAELGITGTSAAEFRTFVATYKEAETEAALAKQARQVADRALQAADDAARAFLTRSVKPALTIFLGPRWHAGWEPTGFPDQSTMIPKRQTKRWNLCAKLQLYFTEKPDKEIPKLGATAAQAGEHHAAIRRTEAALLQATTAMEQKIKARDAAFKQLRLLMRSSMFYIANALPDDDPRWHRFGLNPPADPHVPQRVASLALQQKGPDALEIRWPRAPRATRYRPFVQVVGKDATPKARPPAYDTHMYLSGFAPGDTVRIFLLAANATGEAAPSPTAEITMK